MVATKNAAAPKKLAEGPSYEVCTVPHEAPCSLPPRSELLGLRPSAELC